MSAFERYPGLRSPTAASRFLFFLLVAFSIAPPLASAPEPVSYVLDLREPATHVIRVTMTVPGATPGIEIQFPAWNALYQIRDFVRNMQDLHATCDGKRGELARVDLETWKWGSSLCSSLEVRYAVYANEESPFSSVLGRQHAFMNFALLLFYLPRERQRAARIKFFLPQGWRLATLLTEGANPGEYEAPSYDELADSPAEAGTFQDYTYSQSGAEYRVIVHADAADYSPDRLLASLQKITATEAALMRDVPFSRYTFIFHFPKTGGGGGMEHRNGTAISVPAAELRTDWGRLEVTVAHEFFHAWNVKRIRPQSLEPVDYVHGNDTRELWFSEGLTSTYAELTLVRAGLISREAFYQRLAEEIRQLEQRPARLFQNVEEAGREAWLEKYADYRRPERSISYYNKGELVGFLLDLAIRRASRNHSSLDDVMRRLNQDFARRGRFFTDGDLRALVRELVPAFEDADSFFAECVSGTRELDYDTYLGFAGLRLSKTTAEQAALGFRSARNPDGTIRVASVEPHSGADQGGLEPGDILLRMDRRPFTGLPQEQSAKMKPGQKVEFEVRRGEDVFKIGYALGSVRATSYRVEELPGASEEQLRLRRGWVEGTPSGN